VVIRHGEPYGSVHGTADSFTAPVLYSGAAECVPGTEGARVADTMIEADVRLERNSPRKFEDMPDEVVF
jgi:hypothetical protein